MAKKNSLILCFFLVLLIFIAGTSKAMNQDNGKTCVEEWETICVIEDDCKERCHKDHGKKAKPGCYVQEGPTGGDLCKCFYKC
ncbi:hypothetical protein MKW94_028515 [Papaver nudicaule]|uniref:Uncharacterized protein n=1 Tax=Papaver nudicaule TaxID=74823 RepID=A0AA41S7K0_PAPNU|nr:hypothetical protein [Papaver nudicaule]MCL7047657.1 hypothetical protein [Papaver nudicaule]